jgi:uncharacterized protein (TIGR03437 family)
MGGAASPGEAVVLSGSGLGPATPLSAPIGAEGRYPTSLSGWKVFFDELPAPVIYLSGKQSAVMVPFGMAGRASTSVTVVSGGTRSLALNMPVAATNPAVFAADASSGGIAAAVNVAADGSISPHTLNSPAARNGVVTFYATGLGTTAPVMPDGSLAGAPLPQLAVKVRVSVGGIDAPVLYAGPAPGQIAGLMQINVGIPDSAPTGSQPLLIFAGDNPSQPGVTLAVHWPGGATGAESAASSDRAIRRSRCGTARRTNTMRAAHGY